MLFLGDGLKTPALSKLIINSPNLGSLTSQSVYSRLLQNYSETRHYQDYPWKLSKKLARPTSQFMMLTLSNLFDRSPNYFTNLTMLKLTGECINTRLKVWFFLWFWSFMPLKMKSWSNNNLFVPENAFLTVLGAFKKQVIGRISVIRNFLLAFSLDKADRFSSDHGRLGECVCNRWIIFASFKS